MLFSIKRQYVVVYLDDTVIFLRIPRQHIDHTRLVSDLVKEAGVPLKLETSGLSTKKMDFMVILYAQADLKS